MTTIAQKLFDVLVDGPKSKHELKKLVSSAPALFYAMGRVGVEEYREGPIVMIKLVDGAVRPIDARKNRNRDDELLRRLPADFASLTDEFSRNYVVGAIERLNLKVSK